MDDKIDAEKEMKIFKNLFVEYNLEAECWQEFNNRIDSPHAWDDFDYEICIYSVRKQLFVFLLKTWWIKKYLIFFTTMLAQKTTREIYPSRLLFLF